MDKRTPLKFGVFVPPIHKTGINPTLAIRRGLDMIEHWDNLGYDEVWIGEHHSSGSELIASPEVFIAAAAERTRRIRLGTGVISLPYHHPFHVADRIMLLDHLTQGRSMFGLGPGQIATDAWMLGIDPIVLRPRMEEGLEVVLALLRGETVTRRTEWFTCEEAV
ncbi:MAG: LLM class flavin-dependent oxidoreductase, partial [Acidimicrobiia bacterium]